MLLPSFERRQHRTEERGALANTPTHGISHTRGALLNHVIHGRFANVRTAFVAPATIILRLRAIGLMAELIRPREHHAAALAIMIRHLKELRHWDVKLTGNKLNHIDSGSRLAGLPAAHCLTGDEGPFRKLLLSQSALATKRGKDVLQYYGYLFLPAVHIQLSNDAADAQATLRCAMQVLALC